MTKQKIGTKKADSIAFALFITGTVVLFLSGIWWPGICLVLGVSCAVRQYLMGFYCDFLASLIIFSGIFILQQFSFTEWYTPALIIAAGFYIFVRDLLQTKQKKQEENRLDKSANKDDFSSDL